MSDEVFKDLGATLEVSATKRASLDLKGAFSTQDIKTARLVFSLTKPKGELLLDTVDAYIYLVGETLKSESKAILNKDNATVTYVLSNDEIKHAGRICGELYLRYADGRVLSAHKFHFKIDRAFIDQDIEVVESVYNVSIEELITHYRDRFNQLEVELDRHIEEVTAELTLTLSNNMTEAAREQLEIYLTQLSTYQALLRNGDTATGTLNSTAEAAFNVSFGYLRHYIGAQTAGTVVRIYIGYAGHWGNFVDVVVGDTSPTVGENFFIDPITPLTTYATGVAQTDVTRTRSVINGVEKTASNTVSVKNSLEIGRKGAASFIKGNAEYDGTLTFDVAKTASTPYFDLTNVIDTQSWGRGLGARTNVRQAEIGMSGIGKVVNSLYMGFGTAPWTKSSGLFIEYATKKVFLFGEELETIKGAQAKVDAFKKSMNTPTVPLTLKNGFVAQNGSVVGYLAIPLGNRYIVQLKGWITAATGIMGTMPAAFLPDEISQANFPGSQQSDIRVNPTNGNIEVTAVGSATTAIALASVIYITKEVST
ncbi:BppU family phage baseplate upper protein [Listeria booriae]|uniref:BppU family phage baseplate upper protein n=1 Tax=Listeria booriae TaxID=1552123 RepID=UPI0016240F6B|nr:BppU family phage baseplate upper protein [Listeria booriae]MBC1272698.1 BppU family phage baseplate upper protein [Listeria booriae]MBC2174725.1 BppU family phage baseplate upper protein [Listeria booriae]